MLPESVIQLLRPHWFSGKGRLLRALGPAQGVRQARIFGFEMALDLQESIQRQIYLGVFEPWETRFVRRSLGPGMTFVDIGANVGYFSALAASRVGGSGRVIAVEPSPVAFEKLARLSSQRPAGDRLLALQLGLARESGTAPLYVPPPSAGNHAPTLVPNSGGRPVSIRLRTIDECFPEWGIEHIDLLKIDIEGYETQAFQGASRTLQAGRIRTILCEFNDHWLRQAGSSPDELMRLLRAHGYRCLTANDTAADPGVINHIFTLN